MQSTNPTWQLIRANLAYVLSGKLFQTGGHLPGSGHNIPHDFSGIGVATAEDAAVDSYVIARLHELGIRQVRLDFTYGDANTHVARFLEALCAESFSVMLHLVQPFDAAKSMDTEPAHQIWRNFVGETLDRFGEKIELIEVGSTINRKRWSGYTLQGFLAAWEIAHNEVRRRNIRLAGPNITDFEPIYNIGILSILKSRNQLPDTHTDNLFSERSAEPERFDHKILGPKLAPFIKFNLTKKARLLQKIGADFGVPTLYSPTAFWTLPRIERLLPDSEEKQADYLARYMLLCAVSGALERVFWGPLICQREGLIDDGSSTYPALERVTHYASPSGDIKEYRVRPAFYAFKAFLERIPGSFYRKSLGNCNGLEFHVFVSDKCLVHVLWATNGRAASLADIYTHEDINTAQFANRNGEKLKTVPELIAESPLYIEWPLGHEIRIKASASLLGDVSIHKHTNGTNILFRKDGWQGLLLTKDAKDGVVLRTALDPLNIGTPPQGAFLRNARNAIWTIPDPRNSARKLVVKQPVRVRFYRKLLDRFRPSKAKRSWNGASELLRRGIETARPVAYFEKIDDTSLTQNYYICEYVKADSSARKLFSAFASGEKVCLGVAEDEAYRQLCDFLFTMHNRGVYFRDLSGGNILINKLENNTLSFSLIDTGRAHFFNHSTPLLKRIYDLTRVCNKLHAGGRDRFMDMYMGKLGRRFGFWQRIPFYLYDMKVVWKRKLKIKNLIKLFR